MANYTNTSYQAMDAMYANWTADPTLAPWTADIRLPAGLLLTNYFSAIALTLGLLSLRLYVRHRLVKKVGFDDWMLVAAEVAYAGYIVYLAVLVIRIGVYGMPSQYWPTMLALSFEPLPLGLLSILVRLSVATFFLRALPLFSHPLPRAVIVSLVSLYTCFITAHTFVNIFQCGDPLASDAALATAKCVPTAVLYAMIRAARILNVAMDWSMTLVPVVLVARSSLRPAERASAVGILILAGIGSIVSILGVVYVHMGDIWWPSDVPHSFLFTLISVWENGLVIVVLSLATTRPMVARLWPSRPATEQQHEDQELDFIRLPDSWKSKDEWTTKDHVHVTVRSASEGSGGLQLPLHIKS